MIEPKIPKKYRRYRPATSLACAAIVTVAGILSAGASHAAELNSHDMVLLDRLTWGINASSAAHLQAVGPERWLGEQLHPGRVWAAPATDARLLVVFLRGAYDAANVVVPVSSDFYHSSRPTLGIAKPDVGNPNSALSLNPDWGLHPALRDSIYSLWAK